MLQNGGGGSAFPALSLLRKIPAAQLGSSSLLDAVSNAIHGGSSNPVYGVAGGQAPAEPSAYQAPVGVPLPYGVGGGRAPGEPTYQAPPFVGGGGVVGGPNPFGPGGGISEGGIPAHGIPELTYGGIPAPAGGGIGLPPDAGGLGGHFRMPDPNPLLNLLAARRNQIAELAAQAHEHALARFGIGGVGHHVPPPDPNQHHKRPQPILPPNPHRNPLAQAAGGTRNLSKRTPAY